MSAVTKTLPVLIRQRAEEGRIALCSPAVGRFRSEARFVPAQNKSLCGPNEALGILESLGQQYILLCPHDLPIGRLSIVQRGLRNVAWGEELAVLTPHIGEHGDVGQKDEEQILNQGWSIEAPIDGTVYYSSSPDAPAFVQIGEQIKPGQVIALIEVMKFYYEIKHEGEPVRALAQGGVHGAPIEAGAALWRVTSL